MTTPSQGVPPPPWWIFHVPHDSTFIPAGTRDQFLLTDEDLDRELLRMTDHHTFELLAADVPEDQIVRSPVSRLVVDVERFERDEEEPMAARGMGVVYQVTHDLRPLRRPLTSAEREDLLERWYWPHHRALTAAVDRVLDAFGQALVIDVHTYPARALPYETDASAPRPPVCIGTDPFHTPAWMVEALARELGARGLATAIDTPFSGALVPSRHYRRDPRVQAIMVEVRRDLYIDEDKGLPGGDFGAMAGALKGALHRALQRQERTQT